MRLRIKRSSNSGTSPYDLGYKTGYEDGWKEGVSYAQREYVRTLDKLVSLEEELIRLKALNTNLSTRLTQADRNFAALMAKRKKEEVGGAHAMLQARKARKAIELAAACGVSADYIKDIANHMLKED